MHAKENRARTLEVDEFERAVNLVEAEEAIDGIVVFVWSDFLRQALDQRDTRRIDILRAAVDRRRAR